MSIRKHNKDHKPSAEVEVATSESAPLSRLEFNDPLQFWTLHAEPVFVDLRPLRDGQQESPNFGSWSGAFKGRPQLIDEMAPSFRALTEYLSPGSLNNYLRTLRCWWRIFDETEAECVGKRLAVLNVSTISDITEVHRERALEKGTSATEFRLFRRVLELARQTQKLPRLHWAGMSDPEPERHLPPPDDIKQIRVELKHTWFRVLWRWERADALLVDLH